MIDEDAKRIFKNVRVVSVGKLAMDLGVDSGAVLSRIHQWKSEGIIRIVTGGGCNSCAGCYFSKGNYESMGAQTIDNINLISRIKE